MVSWAHPSPHPKQHLDRLVRFSMVHQCVQQSDRHTDHATSVAIGRAVHAMRPNNTCNSYMEIDWSQICNKPVEMTDPIGL